MSISGDISFVNDTFAGQNLEIFLGQGPARLDNGDINPLAVGVLLTNASIGLIKVGDTFALHAEGTVRLLGVDGVTIVGTAVVDVNTTGQVVNRSLSIPGSTADPISVVFPTAGRVTRFQALDAQLSVLGQTLVGDFSFDRDATTGVISIGASGVGLTLGGGGAGVTVSDASGAILVTPTGIAADLSGRVTLAVPGVQFGGDFRIAINTIPTAIDEVVTVGEASFALELAAGPYLRVEGNGVRLTIAGQQLTGNFAFERATEVGVGQVTTIALSDITLSLGAGGSDIVSLTDGHGVFILTAAGIAGRLSGSISVDVPGGALSVSGSFLVEVNTTNAAVNRTVVVGGVATTITLALGAKIRVVGTNVIVSVAGQTLTADVSFQQITGVGADGVAGTTDDEDAVRIGVANLSLSLGGGVVTVSNGTGAIFLTSNGVQSTVAASIGATIALNIPGVTLTGTLRLLINTGSTDVDETFMVGTTPVDLVLPVGPYFQLSGTGLVLEVAGQRIAGDFAVTQTADASGATTLRIEVDNGSLSLGGTTPIILVDDLSGDIRILPGGVAGVLSADVAVTIPGVTLVGTFGVAINTTNVAQPGVGSGLPAGPFLRVTAVGELTIAGQTLTGQFTFEQATRANGTKVVRVGATGVGIDLGDGLLTVTNGTGFFVVGPAGIAGTLSATLAIDPSTGVTFGGTFGVSINNTPTAIDESILVGASTLRLRLPAGPYLRVEGTGVVLGIAGQSLSGNVAFEQLTIDGAPVIRVALSDVTLAIGDGTTDLVTVSDGRGSILIRAGPTGIAGSFSGDIAVVIPGIDISATVTVEINQTGTEVDETFVVGGQTVNLVLEAGTYVRVAVSDVVVDFGAFTLTGDFRFAQGGSGAGAYVSIELIDVELEIAGGLVRVANVNGSLVSRAGAVYGAFGGDLALDVPSIEIEATVAVEFNTSTTDQSLTSSTPPGTSDPLPMQTLRIWAGPISLKIAGISISAAEIEITKGLATGGALAVHIEDLDLVLGPISILDADGDLKLTSAGVAANFIVSGGLNLDLGPINLSATTLELQINTTPTAQILGAVTLPSGPYVRVAAYDAAPGVGGVTLTIGSGPGALTASADLAFEQRSLAGGATQIVVGVTDFSFQLDMDNGVTGGTGAFVIMPADPAVANSGGIAGFVTGDFAVAAGSALTATGTATVIINKSGLEVDETIVVGGQTLVIQFGPGRTNVLDVAVSDLDVVVADFIYLYDFGITGSDITGGTAFVGDGPGMIDDGSGTNIVNPNARGVMIRDIMFTLGGGSTDPSSATDMSGSGVVELLGIPGVTLTGGVEVEIISTPGSESKRLVIGTALNPAILEVAGQRIEGQFAITQDVNGLTITITNASLSLGGDIVVVSISGAQIQLTPAGVVAAIDGTIAIELGLDPSDFSFDLTTAQIRINTTTSVASVTIGLDTFDVRPGLSVALIGAELTIFGQTLSGDFGFEQVKLPLSPTAPPGTVAETIVRMGLNNVTLSLGDTTDNGIADGFVTITGGTGFFVLLPDPDGPTGPLVGGFAGKFGGNLSLSLPGLDEDEFAIFGDFEIVVNSSTAAVSEQFTLGTTTLTLDVPAGPFLRVLFTDAELRILGQRLSGDFGFQQLADGQVVIAAQNVELGLGDGTTDFVRLTNGNAFIVIVPDTSATGGSTGGIAARIEGTIAIDLPVPVGLTGTFALEINTTDRAQSTSIDLGDGPITFTVGVGPFIRVSATGVVFTIAGQTLTVDTFVFEQVTTAAGQTMTIVLADSDDAGTAAASLSLAGVVDIEIGTSVLVITPTGIAGDLSATVTLTGVPGVDFTATGRVLINNGTSAVRRDVTLPDTTVVSIDVPAGPFLRVEVSGSLVLGPVSLAGDFVFQKSTQNGQAIVRIGVAHAGFDLAGVVTVSNGSGVIILYPNDPVTMTGGGIAADFAADVALSVPGVALAGSFGVKINTTNRAVSDSITVGGSTIVLDLPTGPYLRVEGIGVALTVAGVTLSGDFAFEQQTYDPTPTNPTSGDEVTDVVILARNVELDLGGDLLRIFDGEGVFVIKKTGNPLTSGIAGSLSVSVEANFGDAISLGGRVTLDINQIQDSPSGIQGTYDLDGVPIVLDLPAGKFLKVTVTGVSASQSAFLEIAGQRLEATSFSFEQTGSAGPDGIPGNADDTKILRVTGTGIALNLGDGLVTIDEGVLVLEITPAGLAGVVRADIGITLGTIISVDARVTISINRRTTAARFDRTWLETELGTTVTTEIFGTAVNPTLQAGPYLKVEALGIDVSIIDGAFTLHGNFAFEQSTKPGPDGVNGTTDDEKIIRIALSQVSFAISSVLTVADGEGLLLLTPNGIAADFSVTPTFTIPGGGVVFTGNFRVAINQVRALNSNGVLVGVAVDETFVLGDDVLTINLPAGPYLRIEGNDVALTVAGQTLRADFSIERFTKNASGPDGIFGTLDDTTTPVLKVAVANVRLRLGDGTTTFVEITDGGGLFIIDDSGFAGEIAVTLAVNIPGIAVGGSFVIQINTTGNDITEEFEVGRDENDDPITQVLDLSGTTPLRIAGFGVYLEAFGQRLSGDFVFEKVVQPGPDGILGSVNPANAADDRSFVKIGLDNVELRLGDGTNDFLILTEGTGALILGTFLKPCTGTAAQGCVGGFEKVSGMAGEFSVDVELGPSLADTIEFSGAFRVRINTTGTAVDESVTLESVSGPVTLPIVMPASLTFSIEGGVNVSSSGAPVSLTIAGQTLAADVVVLRAVDRRPCRRDVQRPQDRSDRWSAADQRRRDGRRFPLRRRPHAHPAGRRRQVHREPRWPDRVLARRVAEHRDRQSRDQHHPVARQHHVRRADAGATTRHLLPGPDARCRVDDRQCGAHRVDVAGAGDAAVHTRGTGDDVHTAEDHQDRAGRRLGHDQRRHRGPGARQHQRCARVPARSERRDHPGHGGHRRQARSSARRERRRRQRRGLAVRRRQHDRRRGGTHRRDRRRHRDHGLGAHGRGLQLRVRRRQDRDR